jgi:tetratricopeptide (TPR) repeat protein
VRADRAAGFALHGRFAEAERALAPVRRSEEASWVHAYIAAARGEFPNARAIAQPLATGARARSVRVAASLTLASVLRQTGKHRAARPYDRAALAAAHADTERAHALIGLAADAIGLGRPALCARRLAEAAVVAPAGDWRAQVRLDWVRTEHALATRRPRAALVPARRALRRARSENAVRHIAKAHLFLGVALAEAGDKSAAAREMNAALREARACGAAPVATVARAMLARALLAGAGADGAG